MSKVTGEPEPDPAFYAVTSLWRVFVLEQRVPVHGVPPPTLRSCLFGRGSEQGTLRGETESGGVGPPRRTARGLNSPRPFGARG